MMKKSKGLVLSFIALLTGFIFTSNVFAFEGGETGTQNIGSRSDVSNIYTYNGKSGTYSFYPHDITVGGTAYDAFCMDAIRQSGNKNTATLQKILDASDPRDAAMLYIINHEGSYAARLLASRAFVVLTPYLSTEYFNSKPSGVAWEEPYANYNSGIVWASQDPDSARAITGLTGDITPQRIYEWSGLGKPYKYGSFSTSNVLNEDIDVVKEAKAIFMDALKFGAKVANGKGLSDRTVVFTQPAYEADSYEYVTGNDGVRRGSRTVKFSVTFNKFDDYDESDPINIVVNPDTNGRLRVDALEYQVLGTDTWTSFDSNTDFRSLMTSSSVTINVRTKISAVVANGESFTANFEIKANFKDEVLSHLSGAIFKLGRYDYQRFFVADGDYNKNPGEKAEFPLKWSNITDLCRNNVPSKNDTDKFKEYIHLCCKGNNEDGFKISDACTRAKKSGNQSEIDVWCTLQEDYCEYCNSKIDIPRTCSEISPEQFVNEEDKIASIKGPEDIKVCVMGEEDENNHSYKLTKDNNVNDNPYCTVSCKEDYTMQLPTARYTPSGRSFALAMGIQGTKTCYTDMINREKFDIDINGYNAIIKENLAKAATFNSETDSAVISKNNDEILNAIEGVNTAIKNFKACNGGWDDTYSFDPTIEFDYEEEYIDLLGDQTLKFVSQDAEIKKGESWYCNGTDVDKTYSTCIGGNASSEAPTDRLLYYTCTRTSTGNSLECSSQEIQVPVARYVKKTMNAQGTFAPEAVFYTKYSSGIVTVNPDGTKTSYTKLSRTLDSKIPDSDKIVQGGDLPVALKTGRGVYNYGFKFNNIGEYYDQDKLGRLIGGEQSVVFANDTTKFKGTYICSYVVNCPNCRVECVDADSGDVEELRRLGLNVDLSSLKCELPECDGACDVECIGECVYDEGHGSLYTVHQTSLTNFNPTDRELGANLTTDKGQYFIDLLEKNGESIYDEPEYSFVFTPLAIEFVKNVNANSESFTELPAEWEAKSKYIRYSELAKQKFGENSNEYKQALAHDYIIYESSILTELAKGGYKAQAVLDSREKVESWLQSDYCKSHSCAMVGAVGPAWK